MSPFLVAGACTIGRCVGQGFGNHLLGSLSAQNRAFRSVDSNFKGALSSQIQKPLAVERLKASQSALMDSVELKSVLESLKGMGAAVLEVTGAGGVGFLIGDERISVPLGQSTRLLAQKVFLDCRDGGFAAQDVARLDVRL